MRFPSPYLTATTVAAISLASFAQAQDSSGFYAKAYGGVSTLQADTLTLSGTASAGSFGSGTSFGGAVGYDYADSPWRAEVEFAYRSGDADTLAASVGSAGDFASTALMINGYYMFASNTALTPYVGLGIGVLTEVDFDVTGAGGAETEFNDRGGFAFQLMAGAEYQLSDRVSLFGEARYFDAGTVDLVAPGGAGLSAKYNTLDFVAGVTFRF